MTRKSDDIPTMSVIHRSITLLPLNSRRTIEVREQEITLPLVTALLRPESSMEAR